MIYLEGKLTDHASSSPIQQSAEGAVAVLTLDDPQRRNSLHDETLADLAGRLGALDRDPRARCIVIAGSEKVFASGADIGALLSQDPADVYDGDRARLWEAVRAVRTPIVAAVSGYCLGGGCELAMTADVLIASETARFGLPETGLGLIPGAGGTQLLPRAIGRAKAMDLVLTGRLLEAAEAERAGLVSRVVASGEWRQQALEVAAKIASRPALAQQLAKESIRAALDTDLASGIAAERRAFALAFADPDAREGLTAFLEKREPRWRD
ncbi:MAG TPA: enoyl-CoA hydratase-related protein [Solirubrobacterales bacterium]|jgi:enoyl-CoA hydratase|nr:enoyl-CoA hydratase-related protein [Solirubrobacterales bacterium]